MHVVGKVDAVGLKINTSGLTVSSQISTEIFP